MYEKQKIGSCILCNGDYLDVIKDIPDKKVDMILCDPPYGMTGCDWDVVVDFEEMWKHFRRVVKDEGAILIFGSEPFSTKLRESNMNEYRYDWYWIKSKPFLYQHAKNRPMKSVETISVFSKFKWGHKSQLRNRMNYFPQGVKSNGMSIVREGNNSKRFNGGRPNQVGKEYESFTGFPTDVLFFKSVFGKNCIHPTQKPVDLLEFLVKSYTTENQIVFDPFMGSCSAGVACIRAGRKFIGIEKKEEFFELSRNRVVEELNNN